VIWVLAFTYNLFLELTTMVHSTSVGRELAGRFIVDPVNDFFMVYIAQEQGGPRGAPMNLRIPQRVVYEAMLD